MISPVLLSGLAALGSAVAGGLYTNFSARVMPRLGKLPDAEAIAKMQQFNRNAVRAPFMIVFFGTATVGSVIVWHTVTNTERSLADWVAGGGAVLYLAGWIMTIVYHVPRNNRLDAVDAHAASSVEVWQQYLHEWTSGNTIRAVLSVSGAAALAASAVLLALRS